VGDGYKIDVVLPHVIDDAIRKASNEPLAKSAGERGACLGAGGNALSSLLDREKIAATESVETRLIEIH